MSLASASRCHAPRRSGDLSRRASKRRRSGGQWIASAAAELGYRRGPMATASRSARVVGGLASFAIPSTRGASLSGILNGERLFVEPDVELIPYLSDGVGQKRGVRRRYRTRLHPIAPERTATRPSRGRSAVKRPGPAMAAPSYFPARSRGALSIAKQNSRPSPSSAVASALTLRSGCRSAPPDGFRRQKAARVAVKPTKEHPMASEHDTTSNRTTPHPPPTTS